MYFNIFYVIIITFYYVVFSVDQPIKEGERFGSQRKLRCANWFPRNFHILLFRPTNLLLNQYARRPETTSSFP